MARRRTAAKQKTEAADATPDTGPVTAATAEPVGGTVVEIPRQPAKEAAARPPAHAADPTPITGVNLSDYQGGPSVHLLRSHRFRQMQIRFDREQPGEKYLAMLKQAGWTDRTESEGVWTKQIDPDARWQSVRQMEGEFKGIANAIRKDKGLGPLLEGLAV